MSGSRTRIVLVPGLLALGLGVVGFLAGCNNPQYEAGTVQVEPRGKEAAPEAPVPVDTSTRESSEGGPR